jgi:NAD(P)-dependent dehydrogenase (short-subunit alcohol dehydrogenase family)
MAASRLAVSRLFSVEGLTVVVTGGGRGIGRMIAEGFLANGAKQVFITSRKGGPLAQAAEDLSKVGSGKCTAMAFDLSEETGCLGFVEELKKHTSSLDVLINNAGTTWGEPFDTYPDKAWERVFALNVKAPFELTRACLPLLRAASKPGNPSRVINVGSIAGFLPQPVPTYAYDASKAAVHMLTRKLAAELVDGDAKVTVNAIAPGFVPSSMSQQLTTYASADAIATGIPLGRLGSPEDMAGAALYLASRAGAWVTGSIFTVDGGSVGTALVPFSLDMSKL